MHTAVLAVRRPYTNVICGSTRDSVRLGRYDHTRHPYAGSGILAVQIEERRAELLSRDGVALFRRNAHKRGLTIMAHAELGDLIRDTPFLFEVVGHGTRNATHIRKPTRTQQPTDTQNTNEPPPAPTRRSRRARPTAGPTLLR